MNAQEAIKLMEIELELLTENIDSYIANIMEAKSECDTSLINHYSRLLDRAENELEYRSIILNSAKVLHNSEITDVWQGSEGHIKRTFNVEVGWEDFENLGIENVSGGLNIEY